MKLKPVLIACCVAMCQAGGQDQSWTPLRVPGGWKDDTRFEKYDGFAWYRCVVELPATWRAGPVELGIFQQNNCIELFVGGRKVGQAGVMPPDYRPAYNSTARYKVDQDLLRGEGPIVIAARVHDSGGRGGFKFAPALVRGAEAISLEGAWQFRTGDDPAWAKVDATRPSADATFRTVTDAAELAKKAGVEAAGRLSPKDSLAALKTFDDLKIEQVLTEPHIGQPLQLTFDERGRLWVAQYLQYPDPAGMNVVSRDKFWRVVYDKVSPPPPDHFKGADKITIHEDTDGDGLYDKHKTFVEGLNMATAIARGRGGVWVLNPPYLLFYPDRNNDDVPDGDPQVHLEGFGLEDTHSVASHLCWGPDGWLYASQGSTVSGRIVRPGLDKQPVYSMGQLIWRYHPETRRYEIFAEGGGNAFGVEVDSKGRVYSGHNGGDTRGFHYVQGGYFQKGFGKHGALSNPYTFGYFPQMKHHAVERFTHTFLIYEGGTLPAPYRGKLFGVAPIPSYVVMSDFEPDGSSFKTKDVGKVISSTDPWFRPVDIEAGPDGSLYVADFYEARIAHLNHHDGQIDKTTGRVYRIASKDARASRSADLSKTPTAELVDLLRSENRWVRQTALRLIGDRREKAIAPRIEKLIANSTGQLALESLWALHLSGGFNDAVAANTLRHSDPHVRLWTVRLLCDTREISPGVAGQLAELARVEPHVEVRSQLACSAKRLPAAACLAISRNLLTHSEDAGDVHLPLLVWWALESKAESDRAAVLALFDDPAVWQLPLVREHIAARMMRRYAAAGSQADLAACARLLDRAPGEEDVKKLMSGFELAVAGRALPSLPPELAEALAKHGGRSIVLGVRQGRPDAVEEAIRTIADPKADKTQQLQLIGLFGEVRQPASVPALIKLVRESSDDALRGAAITSLQKYDDAGIAATVLEMYGKFNDDLRAASQTLLASRRVWTQAMLDAVDAGKIEPRTVPPETVRKFQIHRDDRIAALIAKHWGEIKPLTTDAARKEIDRLTSVVRAAAGSPAAGKKVYMNQCGKCHTLFEEGGKIGPDLTSYRRDDLDGLLLHVVNPSAEIREGYENYLVATADGRTVNGFLVDQDKRLVILRTADGQTVSIGRDEIDEMQVVRTSIMPEGQLTQYSEQQIRDLFAYLRSSQPLN
jgi:putative membrane-bound dehydrogenase-like protein